MGIQLSLPSHIRGDYSGNRGSNNIFGSRIINYYYGAASPENYREIMERLYTSAYEEHKRRVGKPVQGTCTWVTQHPKYQDWLEGRTSGPLWLSADPGCGKSVIASFLIDHLKARPNAIVCYFFFKDDSEEQRSLTSALRAILHQLLAQHNSLCKYAVEALKARGEMFTEEVDTLWDILIKAVSDGGCGDVICVVDALDECAEIALASFIDLLNSLPGSQTSDTPLKFLVTSRPYHRIEAGLGSRATTIRLKGEDEIGATAADVSRVIDSGIQALELTWESPGGFGYLSDLLRASADRTFLWVSLVLDTLKDSEDCSRGEFTKIVSTTPRDLAEFYTKILDQSTKPDDARRILNIVVAAARPLTLREMYAAFEIKGDNTMTQGFRDYPEGFKKTVKYLCGLFVRVIDSKVYLVHQTAREFLVKGSSSGQGNWQYTLCPQDSHFVLADVCISYISLEDFGTAPFAIVLPYRSRAEFKRYARKYVLLDYAANHWAGHFRDAQTRQMELFDPTRKICEHGSQRFLVWLMVYWVDNVQYNSLPKSFTHLMIASWLGQGTVVERLLEEGGDINARSSAYGTALNVAAMRKEEAITRMLVEKSAIAYVGGKGFKISETKRSELKLLFRFGARAIQLQRRTVLFFFGASLIVIMIIGFVTRGAVKMGAAGMAAALLFGQSLFLSIRQHAQDKESIEFLKRFCIQDTPGQSA